MKSIESYHNWSKRSLELINDLKSCPQSAIHHAEGDVYKHTQMVLSEVEKVTDSKKMILTSILHDIAKPMTTIWEDGDWKSPGHAKLGEAISREMLWDSLEFEEREEICSLIRFHGLPIFFDEKQDVDKSIIQASLRCNLEDLSIFSECDFKGRICQDLDECLFKIELFREKAKELNCFNAPYEFNSNWARLNYFKKGGYPNSPIWEPDGGQVVIMCGLAGSGKNTWVEKNWNGNLIELDKIRIDNKISPKDKNDQGYIAQLAKEKLRISLRKKEDVLWNATNLTVQQRSSIIDLSLQYKAKIKIVYVDCSLDEAIYRNRKREENDQIPTKVIERMFRSLELPNSTEAHELVIVKGNI
jgi:predicted kinase